MKRQWHLVARVSFQSLPKQQRLLHSFTLDIRAEWGSGWKALHLKMWARKHRSQRAKVGLGQALT